ncbi:MAG: DUF3179 domain-containing protein, partial [Bacteroidota bacterium]
ADQQAEGEWLINREQVFDGGPGKDGIPALSNPQTASVGSGELNYLSDDDLVLVYKSDNEIKAYPHKILDWHEIANDQIGSDQVAITYCPLTGTGIGWGRELNGQVTTFGVSGLLFETNLMPYDRLTDSYWNQMFNQCVNGSLVGEVPNFFNVTQMSYGALKAHYPEAQVVTTNTGFSRDYQRYPYGSYLTNTQTIFPVTNFDTRIHPKEFVRGVVIDNAAAAFRFPETGRSIELMTLAGQSIVVVADRENDFIVSFLNQKLNEEDLDFTLIEDVSSSNILEDQFGNVWNIFGEAVSGPDSGEKLEVPYSYMGFWFAWFNFFPDIVLSE